MHLVKIAKRLCCFALDLKKHMLNCLSKKFGSLCLNLNNQGGSTTNDMDRMQSFQKGPHVSNKYD